MEELYFIQNSKRLDYHDNIILSTLTLSTGERSLAVCFKKQTNNGSIPEFDYPDCKKDFQEIMRDLCWQAERNILAIQKVKSLNGIFDTQCFSFNADIIQDEMLQL